MEIKIYALIDPRDERIRYIGKTQQPLNKRLSQHISSPYKNNPHKFNWLKQLKENELKPLIVLIETCDENNWVEREKHYIQKLENLTNITQGGENGNYFTDDIKMKISQGLLKVWQNEEYRKNITQKRIEYWSNPINRKNVSEKLLGRLISDEHKEILSNNLINKWNDEKYKFNMSEQSKNLWTDETYKEKTLKYIQSDVNKQKVSERFKGKKLSDEHKQKMSENSKNKKQIIIDNVIYESISNASKILNINRELIKGRLRSKTYPNYSYLII
jgi:hypothetical protein